MNTEHAPEFTHRLSVLAEIFDVKLSPARAALYFEALRDLSVEGVFGALNQAAKLCTFFPKPAELRSFVVGDSEDAAEIAWVGMNAAVRRLGHMSSVAFDDAALAETIVAVFGGWVGLCGQELSPEMWAAKRKEFGRVYRTMRQRRLQGGRYLIGAAEAHNSGVSEWMRFVDVGRVDGHGAVTRLSLEEGEQARQALLTPRAGGMARVQAQDIPYALGHVLEEGA